LARLRRDLSRNRVVEMSPFLADRVDELKTTDDVKLLSVTVDRLRKWWRPGLICIGDAAHAMSPIGGVDLGRCRPCPTPSRKSWGACFSQIGIQACVDLPQFHKINISNNCVDVIWVNIVANSTFMFGDECISFKEFLFLIFHFYSTSCAIIRCELIPG